ncbi:hypothetical protein HAZT_HAZT010640 [Hyalella azteca]|uniref:Sulfatase N-terminal domain-containing protein n=1 Tax=Hyalella azteca TaxID=294128 RepID=A0A6A0HAI3_HYAAZ|nr:hypothetical protein HAZT_HAZT010640 [Hyalella azteca]
MILQNIYEKIEKVCPNLVLFLTDDQDVVLLGAEHMTNLRELLVRQGTVLSNAYVDTPLCCPSRSSILTGRYVHNHGAINNSLEGHCSDRVWQETDFHARCVKLVHLQIAGYRTFFAGKYLNQYGRAESGGPAHVPPGWHWWQGLVGNSRYYNYSLSINGSEVWHGDHPDADYLTSVIEKQALQFLASLPPKSHDLPQHEAPFFMMLSTPAPHAPFTPQPKYEDKFPDLKAPRTANFNVRNDGTKHWLLRLGEQPLREELLDKVDDIFRNRLRTLLSVDDMLKKIVESLHEKELLDDTYIIFTSDNGFHLDQFSLPYDKRQPYEFDIRVPFVIRGPGVGKGVTLPHPISNVDLAPTLLSLAGVAVPKDMDGVSLKSFLLRHEVKEGASELRSKSPSLWLGSRTLLVEHSGEGFARTDGACGHLGPGMYGCDPEFDCKCTDSWNSSFACVRQIRLVSDDAIYTSNDASVSDINIQNSSRSRLKEDQDDHSKDSGTTITHKHQKLKGRTTIYSEPGSVRTAKDVVFCRWQDQEEFVEFYDLSEDPSQLMNAAGRLSAEQLLYYHALLDALVRCSGAACHVA